MQRVWSMTLIHGPGPPPGPGCWRTPRPASPGRQTNRRGPARCDPHCPPWPSGSASLARGAEYAGSFLDARAHDRAELLDRVLHDPVAHGLANALPPDDPAQQQPPKVLGGVADRYPGGRRDLANRALPALVQDADDPQAGRIAEQREPPGGLLQDGIRDDGHEGNSTVNLSMNQ